MSRDKDYDEYTDKLEQVKDDFDAAIEQRDYALKTVVAFKEENTHLRAMNFRLVEALASQAPLATTHYAGCYDSGQKHYECALLEVKRLRRPWVGLTEEEKYECYLKVDTWSRCLSAVEDKLREKNGG